MGRPPLIDRDVVIKTALEIVDSEGLEALSMRRLAGALDVNVAALYGYFDNKQDVLRSVDAFIFSEMSFDDRSSDDWTEIVVRQALAFYRLMRRHPNAIPIFVQFPSKEVTSRPYGRFVPSSSRGGTLVRTSPGGTPLDGVRPAGRRAAESASSSSSSFVAPLSMVSRRRSRKRSRRDPVTDPNHGGSACVRRDREERPGDRKVAGPEALALQNDDFGMVGEAIDTGLDRGVEAASRSLADG